MDNENVKEQRKRQRIPFKEDILVNSTMLFKSIDISEGGLYIYTGSSFEKNSVINVTLPSKGKKIPLNARVLYNHPGIGMGLKFINLTDEQKAIIKELIDTAIKKSAQPIHKKKILLIEDNDLTRQMYKSKLMMEGFFIIEARNGIDAINLLKEQTPDLIILDLYMKQMDGFKVLSILKIFPQWEKLPVIVCSARGTQDVIEKVIDAGADEFLLKIVTSPSKLAETAKAVLQRREK